MYNKAGIVAYAVTIALERQEDHKFEAWVLKPVSNNKKRNA
jgi:hypothetical protein